MAFKLTSNSFSQGRTIPQKHTCDGADISPALQWTDAHQGTQSFSLIMDDPDAPGGTWVHWLLYNLPASVHELPEALPKKKELSSGAQQGLNDFRKNGYGGPCPPPGPAHRYSFRLYALDCMSKLEPGATKSELEKAVQGHILGQTELMCRYGR